ncbi:hypothetical protein DR79_412 [Francisella tularensis]|uniref:Uncharacterized protein n=4 Tax=Francisella tularensis TaxID=263 RepID=Q5NG48_FRATT|nr:hypothetical protein [Francisella tularensis]AJI72273.1 hypothetical protein CH69_884 [Francisella tularensis subsp. tularensis]AKE20544.1 hypothetical protein RO31_1164 [Francisella tularensis subsp. tularensis str. SCHU S4 substr. NR-28534]EZK38428.1 hypothetical protein P250_03194 [Francisella tularensis subsp. tularensis str. SCHU S4 substr. FSC237]EZK40437.1 hypothetical protein P251_03192 [Francisella tularensis subsp. tularensis str. SCHU S4 substr. FTS-634/635]EZK43671.1 hypothetica
MFKKILLGFSFCLLIGLCYAKQLPEILKKYNYQQLKLVDTNQEFVAPYLIAKVN